MPGQTLRAFDDHGKVARAAIDPKAVTEELERAGVQSFCGFYHQPFECT